MELQQQVTNLELSKRMKELGFKQESYFIWYLRNEDTKKYILCSRDIFQEGISAYTVAELGEMLPHEVRIDDETYWHGMRTEKWEVGDGFVWRVIYENHKKEIFEQEADTEADARAKMLIYLKENNLL